METEMADGGWMPDSTNVSQGQEPFIFVTADGCERSDFQPLESVGLQHGSADKRGFA